MKKRIFAILLTVVMVMALVPTSVFGIDINKTAESLDENNQTTVTLSVGGTQDVENVAVLFVLDYSTSVTVRDAAGDFLTELASKENTNVKAAVIDYSAVAYATDWTTIDSETDTSAETGLLKSKTSSGTNYHAGLLKAQEMLESEEIAGYTTYLITISDGITYLWTDEETGDTMSVWVRSGSKGEEFFYNNNSVWELKYGKGVEMGDDQFNALTSETLTYGSVVLNTAYNSTLGIATEYPGTQPDADTGSYVHADEYDNYLIGTEVAIYKTASVYKELLDTVDYAYAFKLDEDNWTKYPYGEQLMDYLISLSAKPSGEITKTSASETFANIKDQILYEIMSGTVTDVIGEDFDWVGMKTVELTVGGTALTSTIDDVANTVSFGANKDEDGNVVSYDYVVTYYPDETDDDGNVTTPEYFTWEINVPVEAANGLELTYDLELAEDYTLPTDKSYEVLPTNESAVIDYQDPDGETKEEDFPVPTVIVGEKKSEPGLEKWIVITETTTTEDEDGSTTSTTTKTYKDEDDVAAGDTVEFQLTSNVPNLESYMDWTYDEKTGTATAVAEDDVEYTLTFHDEMDEELAFDENSVTVTIGGTVLVNTDDVTYYTVTTSVSDNCTFEVSMDLIALYNAGIITVDDWASTAIVVTYTATLSKDASAGTYCNTAWVTYPDGESKKDVVEVDTYGISVFKHDQADNSPLSGATFQLLQKVETSSETEEDTGTETETETEAETETAAKTVTIDGTTYIVLDELTTDSTGYVYFDGLDTGTYYLVETEAPSGYVCSEKEIKVTITGGENKTTNYTPVRVANAAIPETGGAGTVIFTVVGGGLIVAAAAVLVISRRKHENEE